MSVTRGVQEARLYNIIYKGRRIDSDNCLRTTGAIVFRQHCNVAFDVESVQLSVIVVMGTDTMEYF